jgi:hypothetical protein
VAVTATLILVACGGGGGGDEAADCPEPVEAPASEIAKLPDDLPLEMWGTVTKVSEKGGYIGGVAISETQIVELYPELNRYLIDHKFLIVSGENEGFEAEVFFQRDKAPGSFLLRKGCGKQIKVKLLFNVARLKKAKK